MIHVVRLSVTPLKSTALQHPERVRLGPNGVADDRRFFMIDARNRLVGPVRHPAILGISAAYEPASAHLALTLADGTTIAGPATAAGERVVVDFWGRPTPGLPVGGPWSAVLSAVVGEPVRLLRAEEDGGGVDDQPLTLVSSASIRELGRHAGRGDVDPARFRMLVEIDGVGPHEEDGWSGRLLGLGEAVVRVGGPVPRCGVTQLDPSSGRRDLDTLKVIDRYRGRGAARTLDFGVYGTVVRAGDVAVGDAATLLEG